MKLRVQLMLPELQVKKVLLAKPDNVSLQDFIQNLVYVGLVSFVESPDKDPDQVSDHE